MSCAFFNILMVYTPPAFTNLKNNVATTLAAPVLANDTNITVVPGTGTVFPVAPFYLSCEFEVMLCSSKTNDLLIVSRGQDNTTAAAHPINSVIEMRDTAVIIRDGYSGVNSAFSAVNDLQTQVGNGTALPASTVYTDKVQELTHKTIDLTDSSKANVIIGTVTPDPSALNYPNLLVNGGFDLWTYPDVTTIPAGTPASGSVSAPFSNEWRTLKLNDSSISTTKTTSHSDPSFPSGYSVLANVTTVQANDVGAIYQLIDRRGLSFNDLTRLTNNPLSVSSRLKLVSGNIQVRFVLISSTDNTVNQTLTSAWFPVSSSSYQDFKFENQTPLNNIANNVLQVEVDFKGVGQVAIGSVMLSAGPIATKFTPDTPVYNGRLGSDVARANLLTNGGFEIWQRGNGPFGSGAYCADRWQLWAGGGVISASRDLSNAFFAGYCAAVTVTGSVSAGNQAQIYQYPITIGDGPQLLNRTISVSIQIKTSVTNACRISITPAGGTTSYSRYHSGSGTYETLTATAFVPASASGIIANIAVSFEAVGTYYVDNAMMVPGNIPADYVPMHPADDLARCLRYYEIIGDVYTTPTISGNSGTGTNVYVTLPFLVRKAVSPTVTKNGTWSVTNCAQPATFGSSINSITPSLLISATGYGVSYPSAAGQNFTIEANP